MRKIMLDKIMGNLEYIELNYQQVISRSVLHLQNDRSTVMEHQIMNDSSIEMLDSNDESDDLKEMMD